MQFTLTGRHVEITDAMRQYAEDKVGQLVRYYDRIETIDAVVDRESVLHRVELVIRTDHKHSFVAPMDANDYYEAIDLIVDKMVRQLNKHKEKHRTHKRPVKPGTKMNEEELTGQEG